MGQILSRGPGTKAPPRRKRRQTAAGARRQEPVAPAGSERNAKAGGTTGPTPVMEAAGVKRGQPHPRGAWGGPGTPGGAGPPPRY